MTPLARLMRALALVAAVVAVAWFSATLWLRPKVAPLEARLVADAAALGGPELARPAHVQPPEPGWFGTELPAIFEELRPIRAPLADELPDAQKLRRAVADGERPLSDLPAPWAEALDAGRAPLHALLEATRREKGGLPAGMGPLGAPEDPLQEGWQLTTFATRLAALELQRQLASGEVPAAVRTCVDGLAVGRELSLGGALLGRALAVAVVNQLLRGCAAALDRATGDDRAQAAEAIEAIRKATPDFRATLVADNVAFQLLVFGGAAAEPAQIKLPHWVHGRVFTGEGSSALLQPVQRLLLRHAWTRWSQGRDRILAAAGDAAALETAVAEVSKECQESWNPLVRALTPIDWPRMEKRHRDGLALLDLLARAARATEAGVLAYSRLSPVPEEAAEVKLVVRGR